MTNVDYTALTIETTEAGCELLTAMLETVGVEKSEIIEKRSDVERFLAANAKHWDFLDDSVLQGLDESPRVRIYIPATDAGRETLNAVNEKLDWLRGEDLGFDLGSLVVTTEFVPNEDWAGSYKKYFKPLDIGERLTVCPEWEKDNFAPNGRVALYIDPGMVFGSGSHETTSLCLEFLSENISGGERVFDAGCGSGILAIGALLFGAKEAVGADIDDNATHVVRHNAELNGIHEDRLRVVIGDVIEDKSVQDNVGTGYDVVCSNIIANVVIALSLRIPYLLKEGGFWIASGIIRDRQADVENAMKNAGLTIAEVKTRGEWVAIMARR